MPLSQQPNVLGSHGKGVFDIIDNNKQELGAKNRDSLLLFFIASLFNLYEGKRLS